MTGVTTIETNGRNRKIYSTRSMKQWYFHTKRHRHTQHDPPLLMLMNLAAVVN